MAEKTEDLIAEARGRASLLREESRPDEASPGDHVLDMDADLLDMRDRLAALTTPQEPAGDQAVRVVTRGFESDCAIGVCPGACSHLMWECKRCSCEGGWGMPRDLLEDLAAKHVCPAPPAPQEGDARERLHAKCDCVPDLGPAHCHLCGNEQGSPVPWPECSAVRTAAPEPEWEYGWNTGSETTRIGNREQIEAWAAARGWTVGVGDWGSRIMRRQIAGPWEPLPVGGED
jgi:hypothetical protein